MLCNANGARTEYLDTKHCMCNRWGSMLLCLYYSTPLLCLHLYHSIPSMAYTSAGLHLCCSAPLWFYTFAALHPWSCTPLLFDGSVVLHLGCSTPLVFYASADLQLCCSTHRLFYIFAVCASAGQCLSYALLFYTSAVIHL